MSSFFSFDQSGYKFITLQIFLKKHLLALLIFFLIFVFSISLICTVIFNFLSSTYFEFDLLFFSFHIAEGEITDLGSFSLLIQVFSATKFPLSIALEIS